MIAWDHAELKRIAQADDLHIAPLRDDGKIYGTPTWIWSVAVDGELYVRASAIACSATVKITPREFA
jgi:hypothetical protein